MCLPLVSKTCAYQQKVRSLLLSSLNWNLRYYRQWSLLTRLVVEYWCHTFKKRSRNHSKIVFKETLTYVFTVIFSFQLFKKGPGRQFWLSSQGIFSIRAISGETHLNCLFPFSTSKAKVANIILYASCCVFVNLRITKCEKFTCKSRNFSIHEPSYIYQSKDNY